MSTEIANDYFSLENWNIQSINYLLVMILVLLIFKEKLQ